MKNILKNLLFVIVGLAIVGVLLDMPYFLKQARYYLGQVGKKQETVNTQSQNNTQQVTNEPNQLIISSLNISAPILYTNEINEDKFQELLKNGVVHYPGTAEIGQFGNVYIFGHSSDFAFSDGNYKTVFALLPNIEKGALIDVSDKNGQLYHYEVIDSFKVAKDDLSVLDQKGNKDKLLTLQTSYPVGTALARWIVISKLKE